MARVVSIPRSVIDHGETYTRGRPVEITDEDRYHHLMRTGRFRDVDKVFEPINTTHTLPRLHLGHIVTVIREVGLGDVLMVLLVIRALKSRFPAIAFRLATSRVYLPLCEGIPFLEGVDALMDLRGHVRNVVDLRGIAERHERRENLDRIDLFALACAVAVEDYSSPLRAVTPDERAKARILSGPGKLLALAVRGSTHVRTWPIARVRSFADLAARAGWTVVVLDPQPVDMPAHPRIRNLTGKASLLDVRAIIAESEFCVSPDSGLQHLAESVGTRCLALYSTTPPALRIGHYQHVKALWRERLSCVPCFDRGCPAAPCMDIPPEAVLRALENWDRLERWTDVDAGASFLSAPEISVNQEAEIMSSWTACAHCRVGG